MPQIDIKEILRWETASAPTRELDELAAEEPLEIRVNGRPVSVTMRTPGHDSELAAGFLYTENMLQGPGQIARIAHIPQSPGALVQIRGTGESEASNTLNVELAEGVPLDFERLTRHVFASSSCGVCGKATIDSIHQQFPPIDWVGRIPAAVLSGLPAALRRSQEIFDRTGGLHAAMLFDFDGTPLLWREDVGRHNALDKVIGAGLLAGDLPFDRRILLLSGRASFEVMQKALAARIPIVAAISAPSSLAVDLARRSGITLAGFVRDGRMNVYSCPERLEF